MKRIFLAGLLLFSPLQTSRLISLALSESANHPENVLCVARNRVLGGWDPALVHRIFYVSPSKVSETERVRLEKVLLEGEGCDPNAWYQWSSSDVEKIHPREDCFLFTDGDNLYYSKCALWR